MIRQYGNECANKLPNMTVLRSTRCMFGCDAPVPPELVAEQLCIFHFTLRIEESCAKVRRETTTPKLTAERQVQIAHGLEDHALTLARLATGTQYLSDELKKRILSTFLTLMVMRERLRRTSEFEVAKYPLSATRS